MLIEARPGVIRLTNTLGPWTEFHVIDGQLHRLTQGATDTERVPEEHVRALYDCNDRLVPWLRANGIRPNNTESQQDGLF